jgi:hypothetical protein
MVDQHKIHDWSSGGVCRECGCSFASLDRRDPCPGSSEAALASPAEVVEPVAYQYRFSGEDQWRPFPPIFSDIEHEKRPLYLHPPQQEPARLREALIAAKAVVDVAAGLTSCRSDDEFVWDAQAKINAALAEDGQ